MRYVLVVIFFCITCSEKQKLPSPDKKEDMGYRMYLKTGDILFRQGKSPQHLLLGKISQSIINDCGIVEIDTDGVWVWHVNKTVKRKHITEWLSEGATPQFIATRYTNASGMNTKLKLALIRFKGRIEDFKWNYTSKAVYNAEFVRKVYSKMLKFEITTLENKYFYGENGKIEFQNLITPLQLMRSTYFNEVFSSFKNPLPVENELNKDSLR